MPHRRLVRIGDTPALPTIAQFLTEMATRQHEEILRLKSEAREGRLPDPTVPEVDHDELTPDPWLLHPVRVKKLATRKAKTAKKPAKKSKPAKKRAAAKVAKKTRKAPAKTVRRARPAKKSAKRR